MLPTKRIRLLLFCLFLSPGNGIAQLPSNAEPGHSARIKIDFTNPVHTMQGGVGASWHAIEKPAPLPLYVNGRGGNPPFEDTDAWDQLYNHATWLGMDWMRVEFTQLMYEPEKKKFDWENREMQNLYKILDWCQQNRADVMLQQMRSDVAWNTFPEWQNDPVKVAASGPYSVEDFAHGLGELVDYLIKKKGYTCIKWLCITNEPPYWWKQPSGDTLSITPSLRAVKEELGRRNLKVGLLGPDSVPVPALDPKRYDFEDLIDAWDFHEYFAYFDWQEANPPTRGRPIPMHRFQQRLTDWAKYAHEHGKPFFLAELGSHHYGTDIANPGPAVFEAALHNAELVVRGFNTGTDAFSRWSYTNRGETGAQWQLVDTYDVKTKTFRKQITPHENCYYFYGLISRFTAKNSTSATTTVEGGKTGEYQRLFAAALTSPKGQTTILVVNDGETEIDAAIEMKSQSGSMTLYRYGVSRTEEGRTDLVINPQETINPESGRFKSRILPKSLTIFSTYHLKHSDPGITVE